MRRSDARPGQRRVLRRRTSLAKGGAVLARGEAIQSRLARHQSMPFSPGRRHSTSRKHHASSPCLPPRPTARPAAAKTIRTSWTTERAGQCRACPGMPRPARHHAHGNQERQRHVRPHEQLRLQLPVRTPPPFRPALQPAHRHRPASTRPSMPTSPRPAPSTRPRRPSTRSSPTRAPTTSAPSPTRPLPTSACASPASAARASPTSSPCSSAAAPTLAPSATLSTSLSTAKRAVRRPPAWRWGCVGDWSASSSRPRARGRRVSFDAASSSSGSVAEVF